MDLALPWHLADGYKSPSQRTRVVTEGWAAGNLYCVACPAPRVTAHRAGMKVEDYHCPSCRGRYQLKAKAGPIGKSVSNSAYEPKIEAIRAGRAPHYAFLSYDRKGGTVTDLAVLPGHFLVESAVERRAPLKPSAERAGWVGSNILLSKLPPDALVPIVRDSRVRTPADVRADFARFSFLGEMSAKARGWTADVLACLRSLGKPEFTLHEAYAFEDDLAHLHPDNRHIQPKIRQQLQVLRDKGVLSFEGRGRYRFLR